jgi:hypothetical protein
MHEVWHVLRILADMLVAAGSCWCSPYGIGPATWEPDDDVTADAARGIREIEAYLARRADAA